MASVRFVCPLCTQAVDLPVNMDLDSWTVVIDRSLAMSHMDTHRPPDLDGEAAAA